MEKERISSYLDSLEPEKPEILRNLREYAKTYEVPIVRVETESLLRTMVKLKKPANILEVGAAIGYSAIVMALSCPDAHIKTIENYDKRIVLAKENIKASGLSERIELIEGDATEIISKMIMMTGDESININGEKILQVNDSIAQTDEKYDFIFLDAAKGQYINWLDNLVSLLAVGGVLMADNVLQDNTVMNSRFLVERRERTTHKRMREFLYEIKHRSDLESSVIPIGDGVSISVKLYDKAKI